DQGGAGEDSGAGAECRMMSFVSGPWSVVSRKMAQQWTTNFGQRTTDMMGPLIILSGPAGSGKSTIINRLLAEKEPPLHFSVSATTRGPRAGERDGVQYHFWTRERFEKEIAADGFLEWADVFGNFYGTPRSEV